MRTMMLLLTIELVAAMKIVMVYFGLYAFQDYFNVTNTITLGVYGAISIMALLIFLKGQIKEKLK